jgi:hypothetical protein
MRIVEGHEGQAAGGRRPGFGPGGAGGGRPALGRVVSVEDGLVSAVIESETQRSVGVADLPLDANPAVKHDAPGVLGLSGANAFYLTLGANPDLDGRFTALGKVIAGAQRLADIGTGDEIRSVRILRSGDAARAFATDDAAFQRLLEAGRR